MSQLGAEVSRVAAEFDLIADLQRENHHLRETYLEGKQRTEYANMRLNAALERERQLETENAKLRDRNAQLEAQLAGKKKDRLCYCSGAPHEMGTPWCQRKRKKNR